MPPTRTGRKNTKPPPEGFSDIEDTLLSFSAALKDATTNTGASSTALGTTTKRHESHWPIFRLTHQRSRYIYDLYYNRRDDDGSPAISKALYDWLLKNGYADANLIAKWKKPGYEKLCCLRCIQTKETNFNTTCICRVPKGQLKEGEGEGCVSCGCRGCASGD